MSKLTPTMGDLTKSSFTGLFAENQKARALYVLRLALELNKLDLTDEMKLHVAAAIDRVLSANYDAAVACAQTVADEPQTVNAALAKVQHRKLVDALDIVDGQPARRF